MAYMASRHGQVACNAVKSRSSSMAHNNQNGGTTLQCRVLTPHPRFASSHTRSDSRACRADLRAAVCRFRRRCAQDRDASGHRPKYHRRYRHGFDMQNFHRNKRSMTLNLKAPEGSRFSKAGRNADIVVENYRPDVKARLGIGYDALRAINKRIILASISGFGETGPYRMRPASIRSRRAWAASCG